MRKFIVKALFFSLPIAFLFVFTFVFYTTEKGDLIRVGYIIDKVDYRNIFKEELERRNFYTEVSSINLNSPKKYTVLTIGDSFSEQKGFGYKNYLAQKSTISVLHLDRFLSGNPIQTLYGFLNSNVLDKIKVNYIILQSVEREFVTRGKTVDPTKKIGLEWINNRIKEHRDSLKETKTKDEFLGNRMIKFPLQNIRYLLDDNAYDSDTYQVKTKENLFSVKTNNLLFLSTDLSNVKVNNDLKFQAKLNATLNDLSKKLSMRGIKLIVLPSPDKFDFYYDYIINNKKYPRPLFFERFEEYPKQYVYINSKKILKQHEKCQKDLYFYDDSHWSPWSSKILANEIEKVISFKK
jgi:hypothetical protein